MRSVAEGAAGFQVPAAWQGSWRPAAPGDLGDVLWGGCVEVA